MGWLAHAGLLQPSNATRRMLPWPQTILQASRSGGPTWRATSAFPLMSTVAQISGVTTGWEAVRPSDMGVDRIPSGWSKHPSLPVNRPDMTGPGSTFPFTFPTRWLVSGELGA
ncbi:hypothetical protein B0I35DRAFT_55578 [Stachybotrys elegans]|uniref:Uncharacterized protein n=1 Tax=Stachybotrys elegans TaxID=80388 RepID=A0A8K0WP33_9HYPO|nr:hypothetical protein B0I35DRAFT_55578 [Stachybotrys elegans]